VSPVRGGGWERGEGKALGEKEKTARGFENFNFFFFFFFWLVNPSWVNQPKMRLDCGQNPPA
jgi:hypothetical protein